MNNAEFKGTKGSWKAKNNPSNTKLYGIWSEKMDLIAMANQDFRTREEMKANAKLIATAPELLEACVRALGQINGEGMRKERTIKQLEQAINKALGEVSGDA